MSRTQYKIFNMEHTIVEDRYLIRGDIIRTPHSNHQDSHAYLVIETNSDERPLGMMNMLGHKAGLTYLRFPAESSGADVAGTDAVIDLLWLEKNWDKWVARGRFEDAIFLRETSRMI